MPKPIKPKAGQESVWDYPRPPRLEPVSKTLRIEFAGKVIAETQGGYRVLETSHPPVYYIPPEDIQREYLRPASGRSFCEWKGTALYYAIEVPGKKIEQVAWYYPEPVPRFADLANYLAFYSSKVDACFVDEEQVQPQEGDFYGGWITSDIVGPFKGAPGTLGW